jgi:DNA-binding NarL/FixJ family response regulator
MPSAVVICKRCGASVSVYPSQVGVRVYCGRECQLAALSELASKHSNLSGYIETRKASVKDRNAKVFALRSSGLSLAAIAAQVGISRQMVHSILKHRRSE